MSIIQKSYCDIGRINCILELLLSPSHSTKKFYSFCPLPDVCVFPILYGLISPISKLSSSAAHKPALSIIPGLTAVKAASAKLHPALQ